VPDEWFQTPAAIHRGLDDFVTGLNTKILPAGATARAWCYEVMKIRPNPARLVLTSPPQN